MKNILTVIILLAILSCEKQENSPTQKKADTLNFKNAENTNLINIKVDSNSIDTVAIRIGE